MKAKNKKNDQIMLKMNEINLSQNISFEDK